MINLYFRISQRLFVKIRKALMGYPGARGKLIYEKTLKSKISCQTPFKGNITDRQLWAFVFFPQEVSHGLYTASTPEAEFKEKHGVRDSMPELTLTLPYVHSRVDSNIFTIGNTMPKSTLTLWQSQLYPQGLRIWPQIWSTGGPTMLARNWDTYTTTIKLLSLERGNLFSRDNPMQRKEALIMTWQLPAILLSK